MRLHSITSAIFFSSFSVRKKRQKVIQGRCDVLENPGDASRLVLEIFLFHYRTFYHRKNGLRCGVLCYIKQKLFAKVIFSADVIVQTCTTHRRDAGKLCSCPASFCRRSWISSELSFASLECQSWNLHKKVHGSGWNPADPPQTRYKLWFNKKHQRNKK